MATIYCALASNLGDREKNLRAALTQLAAQVALTRVSSIYESSPPDAPTRWLTLVCAATTRLAPIDVLRHTRRIETEMGRVDGLRSEPRPIDIDLLLYDTRIALSPALTLPHPRLHERAAVLVPLIEIAPTLVHPRRRVPLRALLAQLPPTPTVKFYLPFT